MPTFREHLLTALRRHTTPPRVRAKGECEDPRGRSCTLCHAVRWGYDDERGAREEAVRSFWGEIGGDPGALRPLVPSPLGRRYRTVTKRKLFLSRKGGALGLLAPDEEGELHPIPVIDCAIEPESHAAVYALAGELLKKPYAAALLDALRYVVVRGGGAEQMVILNVRSIDAAIGKSAATLSRTLARSLPGVAALFLYEDTTDGRYYLGTRNPRQRPAIRKIFGRDQLLETIDGRRFLFPPLAFSQINQSLVGAMVQEARALLSGTGAGHLEDLYCGYGVFALCLAPEFRSVTGVDVSRMSVEAARSNAVRQKTPHAGFLQADLTGESLSRILKARSDGSVVILDPPRNATAPGVIEAVARTAPRRVLHLFCAVDLMRGELDRWKACGYSTVSATPFDMFPGTDGVEMMAMLQR